MLKGFLNISDSDLTNELSQIFIILMVISFIMEILLPYPLFTPSGLIIFYISSKLKSNEAELIVLGHADLLEEHYHFSE